MMMKPMDAAISVTPKACANCGSLIGKHETPFIDGERILCGDCYRAARSGTSGRHVGVLVVAMLLLFLATVSSCILAALAVSNAVVHEHVNRMKREAAIKVSDAEIAYVGGNEHQAYMRLVNAYLGVPFNDTVAKLKAKSDMDEAKPADDMAQQKVDELKQQLDQQISNYEMEPQW